MRFPSRLILALGATASLSAAPAPRAHVFVASDSTAQDWGPEKYPETGWGTLLRCALDDTIGVENRAISARSTRTFIEEGRLEAIAKDIRAGDTLLIQFGHNDANKEKPERYVGIEDYRKNLVRFLDTATRAHAQPVLLTPVALRKFNGDKVEPGFPDYAQAVRELARATGTPLIDLSALSASWLEHAGDEASKRYYLPDDVHFSELGARSVAELVAAQVARLKIPLSSHVLASRPALSLTEPRGNPTCIVPAAS